jgi:hypothetical protein
MAVLKRDAVPEPVDLAREIVPVPGLGGDVIITEMMLDARLDFEDALHASKPSKPGAKVGVNAMVPQMLALAVVLEDGQPLYTVQQWRAFGAKHRDDAITLFNAAMRLNGFGGAGEAAKN